ncbi:MAG: cell division protein FtsQ/DivIB [Muribaculaceae bacterium]
MLKKILQYLLVVLLLAGTSAATVWADMQARARVCRGVRIHILNESQLKFVTKQSILAGLNKANLNPKGLPVNQIDTDLIEQYIATSEFMEDVECYLNENDYFVIEARQMVPVMRIFDGDRSYYVNREGKRMSAVKSFHVDVPVVEGHFTKQWSPTRLLPMLDYVSHDEALNELVTMWVVRDSCNVCFVPSIRGHIVNMGTVDGYKSKFAKLMKFYKEVLSVKGWETYSEITLKWDYQVVGTLRDKKPLTEPEYNPDEDDQAPDMASIDMANIMREAGAPDTVAAAKSGGDSASKEATKGGNSASKEDAKAKEKSKKKS